MNRRRSYDLGYAAGLREARRILAESARHGEFGKDDLGAFVDELERLRRSNPFIRNDNGAYVFPLAREKERRFDPVGEAGDFAGASIGFDKVTIWFEYEAVGKRLRCRSELPIDIRHHRYDGPRGWRQLMGELDRRIKDAKKHGDTCYIEETGVDGGGIAYDFPERDNCFWRLEPDIARGFDYADIIDGWLYARVEYEGVDKALRAKLEP